MNHGAHKKGAKENLTFDEYKTLQKFCLNCGTDKRLTVDHVIPLSKGGRNVLDNLQTLCISCNSKKGTKIIDFRDIRSKYLYGK